MLLKKECKYLPGAPTGMGVRITPEDRMAVYNGNRFYMQAASTETNVRNISASLGRALHG